MTATSRMSLGFALVSTSFFLSGSFQHVVAQSAGEAAEPSSEPASASSTGEASTVDSGEARDSFDVVEERAGCGHLRPHSTRSTIQARSDHTDF